MGSREPKANSDNIHLMKQRKNNNFEIIKLPLNRWREHKELRLGALKTDSQAFLSTYEKEAEHPDEKWQQRLKSANEEITSWMYFAQSDGKLVGMIGCFRDENDLKNHSAQIWGMYVTPAQRGKGIAKSLMSTLLKKLSANKDITKLKLEVNTDQKSAVKLYEHFGFKATETTPLVLGDGKEHQVIIMEKES